MYWNSDRAVLRAAAKISNVQRLIIIDRDHALFFVDSFDRGISDAVRQPEAVLEAGGNWPVMYDWLERVENIKEAQPAYSHPVRRLLRRK
jgi:hypothetical protein